jgi:hypothetical protein
VCVDTESVYLLVFALLLLFVLLFLLFGLLLFVLVLITCTGVGKGGEGQRCELSMTA